MPLRILQKDNSVVGKDIYRDNDATVASAYRATLVHEVNPNSSGTNNQVTVKSVHPVVITNAGVTSSIDAFMMITKFSSLQHITSDVERAACFDRHMAYLAASKAAILAGILLDEPLTTLA